MIIHKNLRLAVICVLSCYAFAKAQSSLSPQERKILKQVEQNTARSIKFLEEVVNINRGTLNQEGVKEAGTTGAGAHTPKEMVNLNTIEMLTKRTAILIYRLLSEPC